MSKTRKIVVFAIWLLVVYGANLGIDLLDNAFSRELIVHSFGKTTVMLLIVFAGIIYMKRKGKK